MNIKRVLLILYICFIIVVPSCIVFAGKPKDFYLLYDGKNTGLDSLIRIDGYYYNFEKQMYYLFYRDGISSQYSISDENITDYLSKNGKYDMSKSHNWFGRYIVDRDVIINQRIMYDFQLGSAVLTHKYKILSQDSIQDVSTGAIYVFHPLENRIDSMNWLFKEKWFYEKGYKK